MKRVRLSAPAEADLNNIKRHIARDNPRRALSFVRELRDKCLAIGDRPLSFPDRSEWQPGLRTSLHYPYLIVFRIDGDLINIMRIVHGARDIPNLL